MQGNATGPSESTGTSGCRVVVIGCGCLTSVCLLIVVVAAAWIYNNWRSCAADLTTAAIKKGIQELRLPEDQTQRINRRLDTISEQYKAGAISDEQVVQIKGIQIAAMINHGPVHSS